jgi:NTP pyrophosphatase (non-canonical NTP hydrolase)
MEFNEYQLQAHRTEKKVHTAGSDVMVPILGLAGEVGELLNEYKKKLRDGDAHTRFPDRVAEELGDILWYVAETATKFDLTLDDVAARNLEKTVARFGTMDDGGILFEPKVHAFDAGFPSGERFPRCFVADFRQWIEAGAIKTRGIRRRQTNGTGFDRQCSSTGRLPLP